MKKNSKDGHADADEDSAGEEQGSSEHARCRQQGEEEATYALVVESLPI